MLSGRFVLYSDAVRTRSSPLALGLRGGLQLLTVIEAVLGLALQQ